MEQYVCLRKSDSIYTINLNHVSVTSSSDTGQRAVLMFAAATRASPVAGHLLLEPLLTRSSPETRELPYWTSCGRRWPGKFCACVVWKITPEPAPTHILKRLKRADWCLKGCDPGRTPGSAPKCTVAQWGGGGSQMGLPAQVLLCFPSRSWEEPGEPSSPEDCFAAPTAQTTE
ncbi:hypothetical protein J0S82_001178 [Galemys pyrenaicus]|uniref:Uncharacterized protein n=1 Tax=Galemys pyrenaicus TaxID=202257 RepID=A0A8J6DE84_GALPY|nr:hypothetical protein J0S82_001178 [Galemys pyrenaicus]